MTIPQYAHGRSQLPAPIVTIESGGSLTQASTYYFALQGQNRIGLTQQVMVGPYTVVAGDRIIITIPDSARQNAEDWHYFVVSASNSSDPNTLQRIGYYAGYQSSDQSSPTALPATLIFSQDEHLRLNGIVSSPAALPTGADLVPGMVRGVSSTTYYYLYNPTSTAEPDDLLVLAANPVGNWEKSGPPACAIDDVTESGGCAQDLRDAGAELVAPQVYDLDGDLGNPLILWRYNDQADVIPAGTRLGLVIQYGEAEKTKAFNGLLQIRFLGYANPVTGVLDTSDGSGGTMPGVGDLIGFQAKKSGLLLHKDLPVGQAYAIAVYPMFRAFELDDGVAENGRVRIYPFFFSQVGEYSEAGLLLGDAVYADGDRRRIVPDALLSVMALKGSYISDCYSVQGLGKTLVTGLSVNTENQKICINGLGGVFVRTGEVPVTESVRSLVSTKNIAGNPGAFGSYQAVAASGALQIICTYPCDEDGYGTIRSDYPDRIAGNRQGRFNASHVVIYVQRQSDGEMRAFGWFSVVPDTTQEFTLADWAAGSLIETIPTVSNHYGLFAPGAATFTTQSNSGTFTGGNYRVCFSFAYANRVTRISHEETDGCLYEASGTLADLFVIGRFWNQGLPDLEAMRNLDPGLVWDQQVRSVKFPHDLYMYEADNTQTDDGTPTSKVVRLNQVSRVSGVGAFVAINRLLTIGTVRQGELGEASAEIVNESGANRLNLVLPQADRGPAGPSTDLRVGKVSLGWEGQAEASIHGISPNLILDLVLPEGRRGSPGRGEKGDKGETGNPMNPVDFLNYNLYYG